MLIGGTAFLSVWAEENMSVIAKLFEEKGTYVIENFTQEWIFHF